MNFSDREKKSAKEKAEIREKALEIMDDWKVPLSINDLALSIKDICNDLADEMEDPSVILLGLLVSLKLTEKFFPREAFEEYLESIKKGVEE